ncbi:hypothetical protein RB195_010592 [Necator americanus]|uniref:Uncharacterized protein n=1 Tax=Necator americanus TaxID=51031 RepID=A0ABR1CYR0_NECAM
MFSSDYTIECVFKRRTASKNLEAKHVTFACPSSGAKQLRESKYDQRKRQTHQQNGKEKKAKCSEQSAQLHQCEEILAEVEYRHKIIEEKVRANRSSASRALNEMGELVCQFAELDNKLNCLEEDIIRIENEEPAYIEELVAIDELVKDAERCVSEHEKFDSFLSDLADRMSDSSEQSEYTQLFYEALPTIERMLSKKC